MTAEDHLRMLIGDLLLRIATLQAEIDRLKSEQADAAHGHTPR